MTNYEKYFSTPEKIAYDLGCVCDCYMCIFASDIPCFKQFGTSPEVILNWLNSEYIEKEA